MSKKLFSDENGLPLTFQISPADPLVHELRDKIESHGGAVVHDDRVGHNVIRLSTSPVQGEFSSTFVDDSVRLGHLVDLEVYASRKRGADDLIDAETAAAALQAANKDVLDEELHAGVESEVAAAAAMAAVSEGQTPMSFYTHEDKYNANRKVPRKKTSKFTIEKDNFIIEAVRKNPRYRTSHRFYDNLAKSEELRGHTGHSVRSRCRVHLLPTLGYVYKTDENGELVYDENGNYIKVPLEDVPKTLKNRFSAHEDHLLCTEVINHVFHNGTNPNAQHKRDENGFFDEKLLLVGISFFDEFAKRYPNHTSPSWRDRFRKFARAYGVQKYIRDYEESIRNNREPEPMKNMTRRKVRKRDAPEHYVDAADDEDLPTNGALDEEIGEVKSSNIDEALKEVDLNRERGLKLEPTNGLESDELVDDPSQVADVGFLPFDVKLDDVLDDKFFELTEKAFGKKINSILRDISNNSADDKDGTMIFTEFSKVGIKPLFTRHILMASSSNAIYILTYLKTLSGNFKRLNNEIDEDLLYDFLVIDSEGLWTPETDKMLKKGQIEELREVHSDEIISERTNFLKENGKW